MSEEKPTNPLYGKFEEVVDALVQEKPAPEEEIEGSAIREDSPGYTKKQGRKRSRKR